MKYDKHLVRLPTKLSTLIRVAVLDLQDAVAAGVEINMNYWTLVSPAKRGGERKICTACLGGAVIRGTLLPHDSYTQKLLGFRDSIGACEYYPDISYQLTALNYVRGNALTTALGLMGRVTKRCQLTTTLDTIASFQAHSGKKFSGVISPARTTRMCAHFIKVAVFLETLGL